MVPMRRRDREVTDRAVIEEILGEQQVCRVAVVDGGKPYIVPLNCGWEWDEKGFRLYVHTGLKGRFVDALRANADVCFEMDSRHEIIAGENACRHSYRYASVIGEGRATFLTDPEQKKHGLNVLMQRLTGKNDWTFDENMLKVVNVICIEAESFAVKKRDK